MPSFLRVSFSIAGIHRGLLSFLEGLLPWLGFNEGISLFGILGWFLARFLFMLHLQRASCEAFWMATCLASY
jgi:hypothetical protein